MSIFFPAAAAVRTVPAAPDEVLIALPGDRVILSGTGHLPRAAEWPVDGDRLEFGRLDGAAWFARRRRKFARAGDVPGD